MKQVYLILTDTGTIFTNLIKLYTKRKYNHASICFDENFQEVYSFGRKKPKNPFIGGFVKEDVFEGLMWNAKCKIYSYEVTNEQYMQMRNFIKKIENEAHLYKYNLLGVLTFPFKKQLNRQYAYFCSEFVATLFSIIGVKFEKPIAFITPYDLEQLPGLEIVYEGKLCNFFNVHQQKNLQVG